jgi:beta-N-acetylhexosaminidase
MRYIPRTFILLAILVVVMSWTFLGCGDDDDDDDSANDDDDSGDDDNDAADDDDSVDYPFCTVESDQIDAIIGGMSLREKVAQMYLVSAQITPLFSLPNTKRFVKDLGIGSVFAQPLNFVGFWPSWTAANANAVQELAMSRKNPIPLFIAIDQEGGIPQALCHLTGGTDQPGNMGLGATFSPEDTYASYGIMGAQLRALGINADFAPVLGPMLDPNESSMYTRSFGEDLRSIEKHGPAAVIGLQEQLVIATPKHFPNHSTATGDEHFSLPVNSESESEVRARYFPVWQNAIDAGTDMIMITHSVYEAWEDGLPTTFSKALVTDVLRGEMGYEGLIVTDDMNMGAITLGEWSDHPDVLAIQAGADIVLDGAGDSPPTYAPSDEYLENFPYQVEQQIDQVLAAIDDGRLSEERIDESVRRILTTKMKYCLFESPFVDEDAAGSLVNTEEQIEASYALHERAITLVRNDAAAWPVDATSAPKVHVICARAVLTEMYPDAAWGTIAGSNLLEQVKKVYPAANGEAFGLHPTGRTINRIVKNVQGAAPDLLIVGTYNALYDEEQIDLVEQLLALSYKTIVIAVGMPYDLMAFDQVKTYVATYSNRDLALQVVAEALFGQADTLGKLPVSLPGLYEIGDSAQ